MYEIIVQSGTKNGKTVKGAIAGKDIKDAITFLRSKELIPVKVTPEGSGSLTKYFPFLSRSTSADLVFFTRQLSSMLTSGLTLMQSFTILKDQTQNVAMSNML